MERMDSIDNTCSVCHEIISVFAIGKCDHAICYKCSTRMRALCEQMYCAICRTDLPEVLFVKKHAKYASINRHGFITNRKHKLFFQDMSIEEKYKSLLEFRCKICKDRPPEKNFFLLKDHMRRDHTLFCCDICLNHLKIFAFERKFYNRRDLATHRRTGDEDDKSYKGHPLCKFCDERYMDNDELLRHLRKDHYFCHFCDDGNNEYYNDYEDLRQHFKAAHYVCELDDCINTQFTSAFRSDIDLKAHIAKEHHQRFSKAQAKEARTLDVNFQLAPRARGRARGGITGEDYEEGTGVGQMRSYRGRGGYRYYDNGREERANLEKAREESIKEALKASEKEMRELEKKRREAAEAEEKRLIEERQKREMEALEENFPSLSSDPAPPSIVPNNLRTTVKKPNKDMKSQSMSKRLTQPGSLNSSEYPHLSIGASSSYKQFDRDSPVQQRPVATTLVTSNVQTVPQSVIDSMRKVEQVVPKKPPKLKSSEEDDFPSLGHTQHTKKDTNINLVSLGVWSGKSKKKERQIDNSASKPRQSVPTTLSSAGYSLSNSFTTLSGKKGSVTAVPSRPNTTGKTKSGTSIDSKLSSELTVKNHPKTKVKSSEPKEPPPELKGNENQAKKNKNKKQKNKSEEMSKPHESASSGKDAKSKKPKNSTNASKVFNEHSDRDSGIESSSGSVDSSMVPPFKTEHVLKPETKLDQAKASEFSVPKTSLDLETPSGSSLDCIAVGLLGRSLPFTSAGASNGFPEKKVPVLDDFPTLHSTTVAPPPPGFKASAPPGFTTASGSRPPPGFAGSSKQKSSPLTEFENFVFCKPANFSDRNKALVQMISDVLKNDHDKFNLFKAHSSSFRQGSMDAAAYYHNCEDLLGNDNFFTIIPELIALLPDISKQQDLLSVHRELLGSASKTGVLKIGGKSTKAPWSASSEFRSCPTCRQVLILKDFHEHIHKHSESDFPSLSGKGQQPRYLGQGSWIKAK